MNKEADSAQMESEEVAAVRVLSTGDNDIRARNTRMEAFSVFAPTWRFSTKSLVRQM